MKKDNIIKKAVDNIEMTNEQKSRIINACEETERRKTSVFRGSKRLLVAAVCVVLLLATTFTVIATRQYLKNPTHNKSHIPNESMTDNPTVTEDSDHYVTCNGIAGDGQPLYFDITISKKDNSPIFKTDESVDIIRTMLNSSILEFTDGYKKEVYYLMLEDSTDNVYHLEGQALFYNDELQYIGQDAKLYIGEVTADLSDGSSALICSIDKPIPVSLSVNTDMKTVDFDRGEFTLLDGGIVFDSAEITASKVTLYGDCSIEGALYELEEIMDNAYIICNGENIPLGGKSDGGTLPDGKFTVSWLNATIIDPEEVTAICIEGKTIYLD
ncbi:MAG: hypothetical protein IJB57_11545 [Clostridia bacterium]|nr:hypothetical protein [Clostridia bacterium]